MTAPTGDGQGYGPEFFEDLGVEDDPKAERQADRAEDKFDQDQVLADLCPNGLLPKGFAVPQYPRRYKVNAAGVWRTESKTEGRGESKTTVEVTTMVTPAPCLVVGRLQDPEGRELSVVAWRRDGRWHRRAIPREVLLSGRKLVPELAGIGFPVTETTSRAVEGWLAACEAHNLDVFERVLIARHLGWQAGGWRDGRVFVAGPDQPLVGGEEDERRPVHPIITGLDAAIAGHRAEGTLEEWRQHVASTVVGRPLAQMGVYASLAAPLLEVLRVRSFVTDLSGKSSRGKTTTLEIAAGCWGNPAPTMKNWNATTAHLENRLAIVRGLPVAIDETTTIGKDPKKKQQVEELLFNIPDEFSRGRAGQDGGSRPSVTWQTIVLTSGERSILTFTTVQGAAARVLELTGQPFHRDGDEADGQAADDAKVAAYTYYGTAGPAFVEQLQEALQAEGGLAAIKAEHRRAIDAFQEGATVLGRRRAPMVAALYVAATLGHRYGVLPFAPPELAVWRGLFQPQEVHDDRPAEALQQVHDWAALHARQLWKPESLRRTEDAEQGEPFEPTQGWAGRWEEGGGFCLHKEVVRRVLDDAGFNLDEVKGDWRDKGAIKMDGRHWDVWRQMPEKRSRLMVFVDQDQPAATTPPDEPPPEEPPDDNPEQDLGPRQGRLGDQAAASPGWVDRLEVVGLCEVCRDNCRYYDPEDATRVIHPKCANPAGGRFWEGTAGWVADGRPGLAGGAKGGAA